MSRRAFLIASVVGTLIVGTYAFFNTTWSEVRYPDGPGESCEAAATTLSVLAATDTWSNSTNPPGVRCNMTMCKLKPVAGDPGSESCRDGEEWHTSFVLRASVGDWVWLFVASAVAGTLLGVLTLALGRRLRGGGPPGLSEA